MSTTIFLSFARGDDEPFVTRLYADLQARGFKVWIDREDMPSRGLPFPVELRDAINASDRSLFVLGPKAVTSDWCRAEWQHAVTFGKPITPVLRVDGKRADGSRLDGLQLLPEEMIFLHVDDFRDDADERVIRALLDAGADVNGEVSPGRRLLWRPRSMRRKP